MKRYHKQPFNERITLLNKLKLSRTTIPLLLCWFIFGGWGNVGHRIINSNSVNSFPQEFKQFSFWKDSLANHGSDADNRKNTDQTEGPKHYIDFEDYQDFLTKGSVIQNYDSAVAKYGITAITNAGSLPWTIVKNYEALVQAFLQKDWHRAVLLSADLGHYIGDGNMPLHLTANYNGQFSSQTGIHSRYESNMINQYASSLVILQKEAVFLPSVPDYIFPMVYRNYLYVDSLLKADSISFASAKSYSTAYYTSLWNLTKNFTGSLISNASEALASVIYTAWVNAGRPSLSPSFLEDVELTVKGFSLEQNYPNPFNPTSRITYSLPKSGVVTLKVFDLLGNELETLLQEEQQKGRHTYELHLQNQHWSSGIYLYQMSFGEFVQTKKMLYLK